MYIYNLHEPEQRSRYSDWLRPGRSRGRSSSSGRVKYFLFSAQSRPVLVHIQSPIQLVQEALSLVVNAAGA
jgi:hypothetical protein